MATEIATYVERMDALRAETAEAVGQMDAEELNWAPAGEDTNSPAAIVAHIAGSEAFWIHQVVGDMAVSRDREAEFKTKAAASADLVRILTRTGDVSRGVLQRTSVDSLAETKTPRPGHEPASLRWAILHQIEHMAQHLGHLTLTRQLYRQGRKP
jgi:uncharacterized damage-inducible protein DinB